MGWQESNENVIEWVSQMGPEAMKSIQYKLSDPEKSVKLLGHSSFYAKMTEPIRHHTQINMFGQANFEVK